MSIWTSAYVAYGVTVPEAGLSEQDMEDRLVLKKGSEVGFLMAGKKEQRQAYLVTFCKSHELGDPVEGFLIPEQASVDAWDEELAEVLDHHGWTWSQPAWFVVASQS